MFKREKESDTEKKGEIRIERKRKMYDVVSNQRKRVVYYHCGNRGLIMVIEPTRTRPMNASISRSANRSLNGGAPRDD